MKTIIYTQLEQKFITEWISLWEKSQSANYVNSPHWFLSIIDTFNYKNYKVIAVYKNKNLVAVASFIQTKKYALSFYTLPPLNFVYDLPFLVTLKDTNVVKTLFDEVKALGNVFIENIAEQDLLSLKQYLPTMHSTSPTMNYYLNFEKNESGKVIISHRKKLMKKVKDNVDKWRLEAYTGENIDALHIVFTIDHESRKQSRGYSTFADKQIKEFYLSLAKYFKKSFQIFILYFEEKPIAYRLGFIVGETYYGSQTSFLKDYQQYWPGSVLLVLVTEYLDTIGVKKIDFGSGDTQSKRSFSNGSRVLKNSIISANILIKHYVNTISLLKNYMFNFLTKNMGIYSVYRYLKRFFK